MVLTPKKVNVKVLIVSLMPLNLSVPRTFTKMLNNTRQSKLKTDVKDLKR